MSNPHLTARTLVLAKIQPTANDPLPTPEADAFLVSNADVSVQATILERNNWRSSLSPTASAVGRKLVNVTFTHEIKGSGKVGTVSRLGRLLRACAMAETTIADSAAAIIQAPRPDASNTGPAITITKDTKPTSRFGRYALAVVTGGASTAAKVQVIGSAHPEGDKTVPYSLEYGAYTNSAAGTITLNKSSLAGPTFTVDGDWVEGETVDVTVGGIRFHYVVGATPDEDSVASGLAALIKTDARFASTAAADAVVTIGFDAAAAPIELTSGTTVVTLGASAAQIKVAWSGNLVAGDVYYISLKRPGTHYTPVSDNYEMLAIYVYYDGVLHKITNCMGTWSASGEAGQLGNFSFTFTGQYLDPVDVPLPRGAVYESSKPQQVELAQLDVGESIGMCAQSFSIDLANTVSVRDCVSGTDGYNGVSITARAPVGGINPEAKLEREHPFWRYFKEATQLDFHIRVGTVPGNIVVFQSESAQYTNMPYGDRNGNRIYDIPLKFSAVSGDGDDEISVIFC